MIKVITGIRRSGKSTLLRQIIDELQENGISKERIIYINFEDIDMSFIKNDKDLNKYIKNQILTDEKYYLFFDEIQNIVKCNRLVTRRINFNFEAPYNKGQEHLVPALMYKHKSGKEIFLQKS